MNATTTDIFTFGRALVESKDLDPVYVLLWEAMRAGNLPEEKLRRWLLGYWCFYHVGTASWAADPREESEFWGRMETAGASAAYPRCHERRHFRGKNAAKGVAYLKSRGVASLFAPFRPDRSYTVQYVMSHVQAWVMFGPWIAFKVADMLERLGLCQVAFDNGAMFLFDSPQEGADRLWEVMNPGRSRGTGKWGTGPWAVSTILSHLAPPLRPSNGSGRGSAPLLAPPRYERPLNAQEAETILCKWKSHDNGHYTVGEDVLSCRRGLASFGKVRTAQALYRAGKRGGLW